MTRGRGTWKTCRSPATWGKLLSDRRRGPMTWHHRGPMTLHRGLSETCRGTMSWQRRGSTMWWHEGSTIWWHRGPAEDLSHHAAQESDPGASNSQLGRIATSKLQHGAASWALLEWKHRGHKAFPSLMAVSGTRGRLGGSYISQRIREQSLRLVDSRRKSLAFHKGEMEQILEELAARGDGEERSTICLATGDSAGIRLVFLGSKEWSRFSAAEIQRKI